jgi:hypothetical protein
VTGGSILKLMKSCALIQQLSGNLHLIMCRTYKGRTRVSSSIFGNVISCREELDDVLEKVDTDKLDADIIYSNAVR